MRPASEGMYLLSEAAWLAETVEAALKLGILDRLDEGPVTVNELAEDFGLSTRHSHMLLSALVGLGVAEIVDGNEYRSTIPGFAEITPWLLPAGRLTEILEGRAPRHRVDTAKGSQQFYPTLLPLLSHMSRPAAEVAASLLGGDRLRVLDVGAGAAPWSIAIATHHPDAHFVALDLPEVVPVTRKAVSDAGVADQFEYLEGDFFEIDLPDGSFDLIIVGGILHLFDKDANKALLERISSSVHPGGRIAIFEALPDEDLDGPLPVLLYALGLITRTSSGSVYPFSNYQQWLHTAGFSKIQLTEFSERPPLSLITALRPSNS